jgi:3-methylcrotonyl-CoA carboxylase alpha subunit
MEGPAMTKPAGFIVRGPGGDLHVELIGDGEVRVRGRGAAWHAARLGDGDWLVDDGTRQRRVTVTGTPERCQAFVDGHCFDLAVEREGRPRPAAARAAVEALFVPMPARVVKVLVAVGDRVRGGDVVLTVEAMKMEMPLKAPRDGTVRSVACREGELVQPGTSLVEIT